jgi:hypothetical protein
MFVVEFGAEELTAKHVPTPALPEIREGADVAKYQVPLTIQ